MAVVNIWFDKRNKNAQRFPITLMLSHKSKQKPIPTGYKVSVKDWDEDKKIIRKGFANYSRANLRIKEKLVMAEQVIESYQYQLDNMTVYQLADIIKGKISGETAQKETLGKPVSQRTTLVDYGLKVQEMYRKAGQFSMAIGFESAVNSLIGFHGNENLLITDIDEMFLIMYEKHQMSKTDTVNGFGAYLRSIRRIYNLAIKDKSTEVSRENYPFGKEGYSIKKGRTKKRAVDLDYISVIRDLKYEMYSAAWHHRNYLLFMFNARGMNFIDLAYLRRKNISNGRLTYRRRKTKRGVNVKEFNIEITKEAQMILDIYMQEERPGDLVFPILEGCIESRDEDYIYRKYKDRRSTHNDWLERIGKDAGLPEKLTSYVIRHTFATALKFKGVSKAKIGDMLGHTNYYTTEEYFDDFERDTLDEAVKEILD